MTAYQDLTCQGNSDLSFVIEWTVDDIPVTMTSARCQARLNKSDAEAVLDLAGDVSTPGEARFFMGVDEVKALNWDLLHTSTGMYDAVVVSNSGTERILEGKITFDRGSTRV